MEILTSSPFQGIRQDGNPERVGGRSNDINKPKVRVTATTCFHIVKPSIFLKKIIPLLVLSFKMLEASVFLANFGDRHVLLGTREACETS